MRLKFLFVVFVVFVSTSFATELPGRGARILWTTYEAENMRTNGMVMGPTYNPYRVETESSGQHCIKLSVKKQFVEFTATVTANTLVIRYSLPDSKQGNGQTATLGVYKNGKLNQQKKITSRFAWLYGKYPFSNNPNGGMPRHFFDETRLSGIQVKKGDVIKIQRDDQEGDEAAYCSIDLADLENVDLPLKAPSSSISIIDPSIAVPVNGDYTEAFNKCISKAVETGRSVWIPAGVFKISGDIILPANIQINGAGMWYSQLVGDDQLYADPNKRVRLVGRGSNIHLADFAITGNLNYRGDKEANDGIVGSYGTNSTISRIWVEHTKVGMWIENSSNLKVTGCRLRNTMADGINFCVGMNSSTIENCTARGTGDDCFAIWPAVFSEQEFAPGHNIIKNCTGQLPFLANGAAIYGGDSNEIANCSFADICQGSAILVSTTFPTENGDKTVNNNFKGVTTIQNCAIKTSGGFDHEWDWRAAIEICLDKRSISGLAIKNIQVSNSLSNALSVITKQDNIKAVRLSNASLHNINIVRYGIAAKDKHALYISTDAKGQLTIINSKISAIENKSPNFNLSNLSK
ncbi:glycosyl hydrolase family 28-related protein [Mucilaginibacter sp. PAMB04168]|uniref:glycosyl hydrolase family 28-related protein n=1 Tax=Mucilaginibacter sp. PAMB04168 TaxID=3138567 RepID=UPI0031F6DABC